jgi:hypothetical protein
MHWQKRIQAVCRLLINYPLSLWMTAEHLNIGKNTIYMIAKQNFGKRKVADDGGGNHVTVFWQVMVLCVAL